MRGPCESFDCGGVPQEVESRSAGMHTPDVESVVVSSGRQLLLVEGPFQPTHFLLVADHFVDIVLRHSDIAD